MRMCVAVAVVCLFAVAVYCLLFVVVVWCCLWLCVIVGVCCG